MKPIPFIGIPLSLSDGTVTAWAKADLDDLRQLAVHRWFAFANNHGIYAVRNDADGRSISMHRQILGLPHGDEREGDHINRDTLDNRRSNLRIVSRASNAQNVGSQRSSSSSFRGVTWDREKQKWLAQAKLNGKNHFIGRYDLEIDAAYAAELWRKQHMPFAEPDPGLVEAHTERGTDSCQSAVRGSTG